MRIVLFHAPPWRIPDPGQDPDPEFGPPKGYHATHIDSPDFLSVSYGLLSLAAQARRAGHDVQVFNVSNTPWSQLRALVPLLQADLFGVSVFTNNRRGADQLCRLLKQHHPGTHVTVGGPHATPMPDLVLKYCPAVDSVIMGEGEATFMELVQTLESGGQAKGIAGMAWRKDGEAVLGPPRGRIKDLDSLANPLDYYPLDAIMTSRGCPGRCTFCASNALWGRTLRFHGVDYVLDTFAKALKRGLTAVAVKDDTFTAHRKRALAICRGLVKKGLVLEWSCDTRVDTLDEELVRAMREAGCSRVSFGVESASAEILKNINKRTTPAQVLEATRLCRKYGITVRYYLIAGNRGETVETFRKTLDFIEAAKPNRAIFTLLSAYPGTEEFRLLQETGVPPDVFFTEDFVDLTFWAGKGSDQEAVYSEVRGDSVRTIHRYTVRERAHALALLPQSPLNHLDLAEALFSEGDAPRAMAHLKRALDLKHPVPARALNLLACVNAARGDYELARDNLLKAMASYPLSLAQGNLKRVDEYLVGGGEAPRLEASGPFQTTMHFEQPILPGELVVRRKK